MVTTTVPLEVKDKRLLFVPYGYAALLTFMLVGQLLGFQEFVLMLEQHQLGNETAAKAAASAIVLAEFFALPFLFHLHLSQLGRLLSAFLCLLAPFFWLLLLIQAYGRDLQANINLFSTGLTLGVDATTFIVLLLMQALAFWAFMVLRGPELFKKV